jgi:NADP-dependent 3-hydroxy acid dehydrogenase YdfG
MTDNARPVVMISGASRGIGAAVAQTMLEAGWAVSLGMRDISVSGLSGQAVLTCRYDALDPRSEQDGLLQP